MRASRNIAHNVPGRPLHLTAGLALVVPTRLGCLPTYHCTLRRACSLFRQRTSAVYPFFMHTIVTRACISL